MMNLEMDLVVQIFIYKTSFLYEGISKYLEISISIVFVLSWEEVDQYIVYYNLSSRRLGLTEKILYCSI